MPDASLCLLKEDGNYYSIKPKYYDQTSLKYVPLDEIDISTQGFSLDELFVKISINDEIFKPIDKFSSFQIVHQLDTPIQVFGCKTKSELLVPTSNIDISVAKKIHYFRLLHNKKYAGDIRIVISFNNGIIWNTYDTDTAALVPLDITIPLLPFSKLSDEEKIQWENAKSIIQSCGMATDRFNALNVNLIRGNSEKIRIAYVLSKSKYNDVAELDDLSFSFDARGSMRKMTNNEFNVCSYSNEIIVTPLINSEILNTHILI